MTDNPQNKPQRKTVKPTGSFIDWSEEDLDEMSIITPADIEDAKRHAQENYPDLARLLDAKSQGDES